MLNRKWIGIEREEKYIEIAQKRIDSVQVQKTLFGDDLYLTPSKRDEARVPFGVMLETGALAPGQKLFSADGKFEATIAADASLISDNVRGSIHRVGATLQGVPACNGWTFWYFKDPKNGKLRSIDELREAYRASMKEMSRNE